MLKIPAIVSQKILFKGWTTFSSYRIAMTDTAGARHIHEREIADHGHAAAVLLLDPDRKCLTLVRQFRLAVHLGGDAGFLLEACAGLLDGDDPLTCARREAVEETGISPQKLVPAFEIYASPGALTEKIYGFIGFYGEEDRKGPGGGLAHEGEEIEVVTVDFDAALDMIGHGKIIDAKTVALIQHAALKGYLA